jgi:ribosomal protein L11 methyltransferase
MKGLFKGFIKENGILIMSGIISFRKDEVIEAVSGQGFEVLEVHEKDDWVAIAMK